MTRINLLPPEIKGKAEKVNIVPYIVISALVVIAVIGGLWFYFHSQVSSRNSDLKKEQQKLSDLKKQVEEPLAAFEAEAAKLKSVQDLYSACNVGRVGWASMLNDLALYVPEGLTTASNPTAPAIWLTHLVVDATPLEKDMPAITASTATATNPILIEGYAAPAWLCIQTWLPRASDFKAHGFLDAYPYYYYFRGQPKVAEFFVRLHNMEEWSNLWIAESVQESITITYTTITTDATTGVSTSVDTSYDDWAIKFTINGFWDSEKASWENKTKSADDGSSGSTGTTSGSTTTSGGGGK
jgi:Tfp pilus assembly protein PilN